MSNKSSHSYHMIDPSPWPMLTALTLLNLLFGLMLWINHYVIASNIIWISSILLIVMVSAWFEDIMAESTYEGKHSEPVQQGLKLGMILFIVSEIMFFFGFFWAYFHFALSPSIEMGCFWPPFGIQVFNCLHVPLYNTFVLLLSGVSVTWCHHNMVSNKSDLDVNWEGLLWTIALAMHFTFYQVVEYKEAGFNMSDSVYGSIFFMATGFHGFHVILGTCFLLVCFFSLSKGHFGISHHLGLEFAMWYWHFVDVVWLFLYVCVYWWTSVALK